MANIESIDIVNMSESRGDSTDLPISLVFDSSYKGDELNRRVAEILNLPNTQGWSITDVEDNLALVHYNDDADMDLYSHLRGILVDTEKGAIVATSFGHTPIAVTPQLSENNGIISIKDSLGFVHNFNTSNTEIKRVFEGVVIRVIWHNGKSKHLTHRRIKTERSHWGSSPTFLSMYNDAGGPTDEQLFDTSKQYSSTCYVFLVSHPSLLVGTRQKITKPYIVYLTRYEMDLKRPDNEIARGNAQFTTNTEIGGSINESFIHEPKCLSLQEANSHLKYGYYNGFETEDERQLTGEAVILYKIDNGSIVDIVKVHSPAYEWRVNLRGNDPNIIHRFYTLLNNIYQDLNDDKQWNKFNETLITLPLYDTQSIKDLYNLNQSILTIPSGEVSRDTYSSRDSRIHLLWMNYVLSLPSNIQANALDILSKFRKDRNDLIAWLQSLDVKFKGVDIEKENLPPRVKGLISSSRNLSRERMKDGSNYSARGTYMKFSPLVKNTLRNLVCKEKGPSLYGLIRDMRDSQKPKQLNPTTETTTTSETSPAPKTTSTSETAPTSKTTSTSETAPISKTTSTS